MIACPACRKFYHPVKNGVAIEEGMPLGEHDGRDGWGPYRLWMADLLECRGCGTRVLYTTPNQQPIIEHYERGYAKAVALYAPMCRIEDER